ADRIVEAVRAPDALERHVRAAQQQRAVHPVEPPRGRGETNALEHLGRRHDLVRAELARQVALRWVLGDRDQASGWGEELDRGDGQQPDSPRAGHDHDVVLGRPAPQRGVDAAREWLDEDRRLIAQRVGHLVDLRGVRDENLSPPPAGAGAVTRLQADLDGTLGDVVAEPRPAFGAPRAWRVDTAH